jgi:hypothetical protein
MRTPVLAACALAVAASACGRIGYDIVGLIGAGGTIGGAGAGGTIGGAGAGGTIGGAGAGGGGGSGGAGASGDGAVVVLDDAGACSDAAAACGSVRLQYQAGDTNKPTDPWIRPHINVFNDSSAAVSLAELTVRYWYTIDTAAAQVFSCDTAFVGAAGCGNVTGSFAAVSPPRAGADAVLEIGFLPAAGTLAAGGQTQPILMRVNKTDFSNFDESNDYSYASWSALTDAPHITVYRNGTLVWGREPP